MNMKYFACCLGLLLTAPTFATALLSGSSSNGGSDRSGRVLIQATFDGSGNVVSAFVKRSSGSPDVDAKALSALKKAHFKPHLVDGVGVGGQVLVPVVVKPDPKPIEA